MNTNKPGANSRDEGAEDALSLAACQTSVPDCPSAFREFIEKTSLERLVYWKLKCLFDRFEGLPFQGMLETVLTNVERPLFALVLSKTKGNQSKSAEILGCNRTTVHRKLKEFRIRPSELRKVLNEDLVRELGEDGY